MAKGPGNVGRTAGVRVVSARERALAENDAGRDLGTGELLRRVGDIRRRAARNRQRRVGPPAPRRR